MSELSQLRQLLSAYFNESELKTLTFDLGLDYEMLPGPAKGDKARELVMLLWRNDRLAELLSLAWPIRPNLAWPDLPVPAAPSAPASAMPAPIAATSGPQPGSSPFTYGNPISDPARFFGRSREVEQVFNRLRNAEGESSSIVGGRRIGKSSLLNYLAHPDVRRRHGMDPQQALFIYVDLQMVDNQTTPARLWQRLLGQLARQCQDEALAVTLNEIIAAGSFDNFALADLFDNVDRLGRHVVFLLDEFENVTINPNFDPSFFYGLRSLAIQHNLSLVTSSRHELIELTHSQAVRSSPFFNIFATIHMPLFSSVETERLIHGLLAGTGVEFTEEEMATLAEIADGHPFFVQAGGPLPVRGARQLCRRDPAAGGLAEGFSRGSRPASGSLLAHDRPARADYPVAAGASDAPGGRAAVFRAGAVGRPLRARRAESGEVGAVGLRGRG